MAYTVPTFNLSCNIWSGTALPPNPKRLTSVCNLAFGRRHHNEDEGFPHTLMYLLLPLLTDIRGSQGAPPAPDLVECPAGSGRHYLVMWVDDIGKGFANEHRVAGLAQTTIGGAWPTPIP